MHLCLSFSVPQFHCALLVGLRLPHNKGSTFRVTTPFFSLELIFSSLQFMVWLSSLSVSLLIQMQNFGWVDTFFDQGKRFFFQVYLSWPLSESLGEFFSLGGLVWYVEKKIRQFVWGRSEHFYRWYRRNTRSSVRWVHLLCVSEFFQFVFQVFLKNLEANIIGVWKSFTAGLCRWNWLRLVRAKVCCVGG